MDKGKSEVKDLHPKLQSESKSSLGCRGAVHLFICLFIVCRCFACLNVYVSPACMVPKKIKEGIKFPELELQVGYEPACGC